MATDSKSTAQFRVLKQKAKLFAGAILQTQSWHIAVTTLQAYPKQSQPLAYILTNARQYKAQWSVSLSTKWQLTGMLPVPSYVDPSV
jgi:hypothetical protein